MPGDLPEIFGALAVGLAAIAVLISLVAWCRRQRVQWMLYVHISWLDTARAVVVLPFVFGFGVVVQDITDHLTDSEYRITGIGALQHNLMRSEGSHRVKALLGDVLEADWDPGALWNHVAAERDYLEKLLSRFYPADDVTGFLDDPADFARKRKEQSKRGRFDLFKTELSDLEKMVNTIYYEAKNWAYREDNYFDELEAIQRRIDFSRSIFLVGSWGVVLFVVASLICLPRWWRRRVNLKGPIVRLARSLLALAIVCVFSWLGYAKSEHNFNERVFGYFFSHLRASGLAESARDSAGGLIA